MTRPAHSPSCPRGRPRLDSETSIGRSGAVRVGLRATMERSQVHRRPRELPPLGGRLPRRLAPLAGRPAGGRLRRRHRQPALGPESSSRRSSGSRLRDSGAGPHAPTAAATPKAAHQSPDSVRRAIRLAIRLSTAVPQARADNLAPATCSRLRHSYPLLGGGDVSTSTRYSSSGR